ncbi:SURF1 family-domain-containing protein [Globomyces pollinis-pini]|nr:SURF1 family-domain-containing protein [Globomyces pollinis-pini]
MNQQRRIHSKNILWVIPSVTFGLGVWQIKRKQWKENLIEKAKSHIHDPPIPLPTLDEIDESMEFTRVKTNGKFLYDKEILVGPRPRNHAMENSAAGDGRSTTNSGYLVYTPFQLSNGECILVNRGWLPLGLRDSKTRFDIKDQVDIEGFIREGEPQSRLVTNNNPKTNTWYRADLEEMSNHCSTKPVLLELTADSDVNSKFVQSGFPLLRIPAATFRNQHLEYALTWFGLTVATTGLLLFGKKGSRRNLFKSK